MSSCRKPATEQIAVNAGWRRETAIYSVLQITTACSGSTRKEESAKVHGAQAAESIVDGVCVLMEIARMCRVLDLFLMGKHRFRG